MKIYLIVILILASTMVCMADDVVRLRNGSVIKGKVIEYNEEYILIRMPDESNFRCGVDEVVGIKIEQKGEIGEDSIVSVRRKKEKKINKPKRVVTPPKDRRVSFGGLADVRAGAVEDGGYALAISATFGARIKDFAFFGGGLSYIRATYTEYNPNYNYLGDRSREINSNMLAEYFEIRFYRNKNIINFSGGFRLGAALDFRQPDVENLSVYLHLNVGARFKVGSIGINLAPYAEYVSKFRWMYGGVIGIEY